MRVVIAEDLTLLREGLAALLSECGHEVVATVGATGPTNWWLYGLGALAIIIAILLIMQMFSGAPGTDMQPGTPTSEPVVETPAE